MLVYSSLVAIRAARLAQEPDVDALGVELVVALKRLDKIVLDEVVNAYAAGLSIFIIDFRLGYFIDLSLGQSRPLLHTRGNYHKIKQANVQQDPLDLRNVLTKHLQVPQPLCVSAGLKALLDHLESFLYLA